MNDVLRRARGPLLLLLGTCACMVPNRQSVEIFTLCALPDDATVCSASSPCAASFGGRPWVTTIRGYDGLGNVVNGELFLPVQVNNQLPNDADPSSGRANGNDAFIDRIELSFEADGLSIPSVELPQRGTIPAAGNAAIWMVLVPAEVSELLRTATADGEVTSVVVSLKVKGHYANNGWFETGSFTIPVEIWNEEFVLPGCPPSGDPPVSEPPTAVCPQTGQSASYACGE